MIVGATRGGGRVAGAALVAAVAAVSCLLARDPADRPPDARAARRMLAEAIGAVPVRLAPGTKAKVTAGTIEREGAIDHVSGIVDPDRHTVPVRVRLANTAGALRPHAYTPVRFFDPTTARVALPAAAVMSDGAKSYVYIKQGSGELVRKDITVGSASEGKVPVLAGLEPSDQVVLRGAILLDNQIQLDN